MPPWGWRLGPALDDATTWQTAFLIAGAPGLLLALVSLAIPEPVRGISEGVAIPRLRLHEGYGRRRGGLHRPDGEFLVHLFAVFGLTFTTFAIGGLFYWLPSFLIGVRQIPPSLG